MSNHRIKCGVSLLEIILCQMVSKTRYLTDLKHRKIVLGYMVK